MWRFLRTWRVSRKVATYLLPEDEIRDRIRTITAFPHRSWVPVSRVSSKQILRWLGKLDIWTRSTERLELCTHPSGLLALLWWKSSGVIKISMISKDAQVIGNIFKSTTILTLPSVDVPGVDILNTCLCSTPFLGRTDFITAITRWILSNAPDAPNHWIVSVHPKHGSITASAVAEHSDTEPAIAPLFLTLDAARSLGLERFSSLRLMEASDRYRDDDFGVSFDFPYKLVIDLPTSAHARVACLRAGCHF